MVRAAVIAATLALALAAGPLPLPARSAAFLADVKKRATAVSDEAKISGEPVHPRTAHRVLIEALAASKYQQLQNLHSKLENITVTTSYGQVTGIGGGNSPVNQFLGVPFAAPPVGPNRWRAPQPLKPWTTPHNATWFGLTCMQTEWYWGILTGVGEDCLNMDIYVPNNSTPPPGGYPVMLFWYGGSFTFGGASFPLYDGESDVAIMEDVILVAANYRLNVFGFLAGDELLAESPDGSVGNYGFQDQRAALTFVKNEIAAFGGNPAKITIFGESAGGASVANHLVSPRSQGLFQQGIIESGSFSDWTAQPYNISKTRLPQVAKNVKCNTGPTLLACLRSLNETTMLAADKSLTHGQLEWSPVIDGVEVIADPRSLAAAGKAAQVPVMLGFNADEGTLFDSAPTNLNASQYVDALATIIGLALAEQVAALYPLSSYESPWWAISAVLRDSQMLCPGLQSGAWLTQAGRTQPAFVYFYTQILAIIDIVDIFRELRCFHGSELVSVFDFSVLLLGPGEPDMAKTFVSYWTNFAMNGDPNVGKPVPKWTSFGAGAGGNVARISTTPAGVNVTMVTGVQGQQCAFWKNVSIAPSVIWGG